MNNIIEHNGEVRFANGQNSRDLRVNSGATEPNDQIDVRDLREHIELSDGLEALRRNTDEIGRAHV